MLIIWILVRISSVCCEIDHSCLLIYLKNLFHMPWSFSNTVLQVALVIVKVKMCPAVAFAPLDEFLAATENLEVACFLICVHAFLDDRDNAVLTYCV